MAEELDDKPGMLKRHGAKILGVGGSGISVATVLFVYHTFYPKEDALRDRRETRAAIVETKHDVVDEIRSQFIGMQAQLQGIRESQDRRFQDLNARMDNLMQGLIKRPAMDTWTVSPADVAVRPQGRSGG